MKSWTRPVTINSHFTYSEFRCKCGICDITIVDDILIDKLNQLRSAWNKPINVNCCYRCEQHNKDVGGVRLSFHRIGQAADLALPGINDDVFISSCAAIFPFTKVYPSKKFIHVSLEVK